MRARYSSGHVVVMSIQVECIMQLGNYTSYAVVLPVRCLSVRQV